MKSKFKTNIYEYVIYLIGCLFIHIIYDLCFVRVIKIHGHICQLHGNNSSAHLPHTHQTTPVSWHLIGTVNTTVQFATHLPAHEVLITHLFLAQNYSRPTRIIKSRLPSEAASTPFNICFALRFAKANRQTSSRAAALGWRTVHEVPVHCRQQLAGVNNNLNT